MLSLMCAYSQMYVIFIQLALWKHERNYVGDLHFLQESILRRVILEVAIVPNWCVCPCVCDCAVVHTLQSKTGCQSSWASDYLWFRTWLADWKSTGHQKTARNRYQRMSWNITASVSRSLSLSLCLIPLWETLFIFLFLKWLWYIPIFFLLFVTLKKKLIKCQKSTCWLCFKWGLIL